MQKAFVVTVMMMVVTSWAGPVLAGEEAPPRAASDEGELTNADRRILARGELSRGRIVGSGALGTLVGFGMGHLVQGRFGERGWIFATVEGSSLAVAGTSALLTFVYAEGDGGAAGAGIALGSLAVFGIARIWEAVDVWTYPSVHNRRFRELNARTNDAKVSLQLTPNVGGATVGLAVRF